MIAIYLLVIGLVVYVISTFVLGKCLRIIHSKKAAEIITRIMHLILICSVPLPLLYAIFNPILNINDYDMLLNIPSLPFPAILKVIGVVMFVIGVVLASIAQILLLGIGEGFPLLSLTKKLTDNLLYERTRNPMLLGLYLTVVGMGLSAGSTFFTFWSLMALIPANIFWLKYFEERELEMRFGQSYREYKQRVPFLIPSFRKMTGTKSVNNND